MHTKQKTKIKEIRRGEKKKTNFQMEKCHHCLLSGVHLKVTLNKLKS